MEQKEIISVLFATLLSFAVLNSLLSGILLYVNRARVFKLLGLFWPSVLIFYGIQFLAHDKSQIIVALGFCWIFVMLTLSALIGFEFTGRLPPFKRYISAHLSSLIAMGFLYYSGASFTVYMIPVCISAGYPMVSFFFYTNIVDRKRTTSLQKVLGFTYIIMAINNVNFAVFRFTPEVQIFGWAVSYALYDALAILLPTLSLELASLTESKRLNALIALRTGDLEKSLKENKHLIKVILHDISSPIFAITAFANKLKKLREYDEESVESISLATESITGLLSQTRDIYQKSPSKELKLAPVSIEECIDEITLIFSEPLKMKHMSLSFENGLRPSSMILADKPSLTHNVLSNLVSNAIKFSPPGTSIHITASEAHDNAIISVEDFGIGIHPEIIDRVFSESEIPSTVGFEGQIGSGMGLSILKTVVELSNGEIQFIKKKSPHTGTIVKITLGLAKENLNKQEITISSSLSH